MRDRLEKAKLDKLPLRPLRQQALRDRVVTAIRDAVIQGSLRPGDKVPEDELAGSLGVSRTPVREAIRILELQGLVVVRPKKGTYVATVEAADESDGLAVRESLEELAVRQAIARHSPTSWQALCDRLEGLADKMQSAVDKRDLITAVEHDMDFHSSLIDASGNHYLLRTWHMVGVPLLIWSPERDLYSDEQPAWTEGFASGHASLVTAFRTQDAPTAVDALITHFKGKVSRIGARAH